MSMFLDIFAALLAVSAAVAWLSTRGELLPDRDDGHVGKVRKA
jgi:hypothetical protein